MLFPIMRDGRIVCPASVAEVAEFANVSEQEALDVLRRLDARSDLPIHFDAITGEITVDAASEAGGGVHE